MNSPHDTCKNRQRDLDPEEGKIEVPPEIKKDYLVPWVRIDLGFPFNLRNVAVDNSRGRNVFRRADHPYPYESAVQMREDRWKVTIKKTPAIVHTFVSFLKWTFDTKDCPCDNCLERQESLDNAYDINGRYIGGCSRRAAPTTEIRRFFRALNGCTVQRTS